MATDKITLYDIFLAPIFVVGACYFIWDSIKDMRRGENRPVVTEEDIFNAYNVMLESNDFTFDDDDDD